MNTALARCAGLLIAGGVASTGLVAGGPVTGATASPAPAAQSPAAGCRVVRLAEPAWGYDGGVIDIEVVDGQPVYYGSTFARDKHGEEHQRALVWRGLRAQPVRVGPAGYDEDIAFELTANGLINGQSMDWETGTEVAWVQDLTTGRLTVLDTDSGPAGADHGRMWIRRLNSYGAVAGVIGRNQSDPWTDSVVFDTPTSAARLLPGSAEGADSGALGLNDLGQVTGYLSTREIPEFPGAYFWDPVIWEPDGGVTPLSVQGGFDAAPRGVKDDGSASGSMSYGSDLLTAHIEPAYWPTPSTVEALGVLPGGGWGDVFGMDEGGWLVGALDRGVKPNDPLGEDGSMRHGFLRTPSTTPGTLRVLPSLYAVSKGTTDWRRWTTGAVHAVNRELGQAGSGSHVEFRYGRPVYAPTVWLGAEQCGREVATTHDPFGVEEAAVQVAPEKLERATRRSARLMRDWRAPVGR